jgi:hypothetical protein
VITVNDDEFAAALEHLKDNIKIRDLKITDRRIEYSVFSIYHGMMLDMSIRKGSNVY